MVMMVVLLSLVCSTTWESVKAYRKWMKMTNMETLLSWISAKGLAWFQLLAVVSAIVLFISLIYPIQCIENKYVAVISSGFFLFGIVEWSQWKGYSEWKQHKFELIHEPYWEKETKYYHVILKITALFLIILPLLKLIFEIEIIPFPK